MPEISFHAMAGATHPRTLRLQGVLKNREVTVLIDGRSTHNFIDQSIVSSLGLPVVRETFQVMVGNRETISCSGRCLSLTLGIQNQRVQADFYVLPVAACPIVLGVQWLETLGPVELDYKKLTMRFIHRGRPCSFQGLDKFGLEPLGDTELLHISGMGYFLQITSVPVDQSSNQAPMPSDLSSLLAQYAEVFAVPIGLPPQRPHDHRIPLLADHQPYVGPSILVSPEIPAVSNTSDSSTCIPQPEAILASRIIHKGKYRPHKEVLVQWSGAPPGDAMWENSWRFSRMYPGFVLEDKDV
ncbi:hypothetical protein MRB53_035499 [Persea americana]|uniref:Uncharacterized protein n=1 Tax=Persea americana TaxID=3435 RepID=A0ACC2K5A9_PERAE|nr:hypothetical protein MRB53_035499 [Persea americana]